MRKVKKIDTQMYVKMTFRQRILKLFYPLVMTFRNLAPGKKILYNEKKIEPSESFYELSIELIDGKIISLKNFMGKKILLVNTASDCGYTAQYAELQKLSDHFKNQLIVIGFPANDFKEQEKGSDQEVAAFCRDNFDVSFPLAKKSKVVKSIEQNEVFHWLTHKKRNGWNDKMPSWNFSKYLVDEQGMLTHYFDASVSPIGHVVIKAINQ
ncbi:MAG: glutathione peroxidase [Bacteroidota bacterium]|nr:glutathione peroxidase [Bacteroidota bacterium]